MTLFNGESRTFYQFLPLFRGESRKKQCENTPYYYPFKDIFSILYPILREVKEIFSILYPISREVKDKILRDFFFPFSFRE